MLQGDYRNDGSQQLICVSVEGEGMSYCNDKPVDFKITLETAVRYYICEYWL